MIRETVTLETLERLLGQDAQVDDLGNLAVFGLLDGRRIDINLSGDRRVYINDDPIDLYIEF